jgi:hypothetical protein
MEPTLFGEIQPTYSPSTDPNLFIEAWNEMAAECGLRLVVVFGKHRRIALTKAIKEFGTQAILDTIRIVGKSSFCHGQNERGWKAKFDFVLQPKSITNALEGVYDDRGRKPLNPDKLTGWAAVAYDNCETTNGRDRIA